MSILWTIKGQTGKTVDATTHTLPALQAQGAVVEINSLATDTMSWTVWLATPGQATTLVPDLGQKITLYRDGARYFTGTVTKRRIRFQGGSYSASIVVSGPWWDLAQIFLSSDIPDQGGTYKERSAFVFATGSPSAFLSSLIARAITLGAPIRAGSLAACFNVPRLSLRNISFAEAFSEVMRWVADGLLYFDYSGSDTAFPALCMQRRGAATVLTLAPSDSVTVPNIDVSPRLDLQVETISVFYAARATVANERVTTWQTLTAGTATSGLPRRQPVMISGPELDTWLPADFTDNVVVSSAPVASNTVAMLLQYDDRLRASGLTTGAVGTYHINACAGQGAWDLPGVAPSITDADGSAIPSGYGYFLTLGTSKEWWANDGIPCIQARVTATIYAGLVYYHTSGGVEPATPNWAKAIGAQVYYYLTIGLDGILTTNRIFATTCSVTVPLVQTAWSATTLIRSEDYAFINPPSDLATNLLATQNWLPYEGTVGYIAPAIPAAHAVGGRLNVSGLGAELAAMGAMISGYTATLATGEIGLTLGAPGRFAYRDLVNRFRQSGTDNIVWI